MQIVRFGVLSTANIGTAKVIPALQKCESCEVLGIASRGADKAQKAASDLGIPKSYDSYEALLADPEIDAIYNPLPNHLHVDWSIKALEAGKHVLCEKPLGLDVDDAQRLVDAAARFPKLKVMEAFMYRFHPQWQTVRNWVNEGKIGQLRSINSIFTYFNDDASNIRNQPELGGGALMDIGCYCISYARFLFGRKPERIIGLVDRDPVLKTDRLTSGMLDFGTGSCTFTCSTQLHHYQRTQIFGTTGNIVLEIPCNAPPDAPTRAWLSTHDGVEEVTFPAADQYTCQGDAFAKAVLDDTPVPTPLSDAIENMQVIKAIFDSEVSNRWIQL